VLEVAAVAGASGPAAVVLEEAATMMFAGVFNKQSPKVGERFIPPDSAPISADPLRYYTPEFQRLTKQKIDGIRAPILVTRGSERGGRFNSEVIVPELKAAGKTVEEKTYEGEPHCFAFGGRLTDAPIAVRTPRPVVALRAFEDADAFLRRHLKIQPTPVSPNLVRQVSVPIE
jgi:acetyl esterase/lipase